MGFSRSCPSSLDLLNSVVRECRPETAEIRRLVPPRAAASHSQEPGSKIQESGNLEIQESGNPGIWNSGNLGSKKERKKKTNIKIKIRIAQNVGEVWISRKKYPGPNQVNSSHWPTKANKKQNFGIFQVHGKIDPKWPQMGPGFLFLF